MSWLWRQPISLALMQHYQKLCLTRGLASGSHDDHSHEGHVAKVGSGEDRGIHVEGYHDPSEELMERQDPNYRPGSDHYAYENPWPTLNKGRFDWLFGNGWRRPLAKEQGQFPRRNWEPFGFNIYDEYDDWRRYHWYSFWFFSSVVWFSAAIIMMKADWPDAKNWAKREAFLEMERRERAGLPLIGKDYIEPSRVLAVLPSDEELKQANFDIII